MIFNGGTILKISSHYVGNKSVDDKIILTKEGYNMSNTEDLVVLTQHFLEPMRESFEQYNFDHEMDINLHELNYIVKQVFNDSDSFHEYSKQIAQFLFHKTLHPRIISGDFYAVLFKDCIIEGEVVNALGLYKFDSKQQFIKSGYKNEHLSLTIEKGILQKKIDKGAIIFNLDQDSGYKILLTDKKNSQGEARFWADEFLKIKPVATSFSDTQNYLNLAKQFVTNHLAENVEVTKADQVDLLNKSVSYFKSHDQFNEDEFANELLGDDKNALASFKEFKSNYQVTKDVQFPEDFEISDIAVKKTAKVFKRVIKLDKNFDVHIHGDRNLIEKGIDPISGKKFYKIYFDQEF